MKKAPTTAWVTGAPGPGASCPICPERGLTVIVHAESVPERDARRHRGSPRRSARRELAQRGGEVCSPPIEFSDEASLYHLVLTSSQRRQVSES